MVKIGELKLKNPVMTASGTFGYAKEFEDLVHLKNLGAIVTKTITLNRRDGNSLPRICEVNGGMLNSIGLENEGVDYFIKEKLPYLSKIGTHIIISISGDNIKEFCELAKRLDRQKSVSGIELNISCPNITHHPSPITHYDLIAQDKDAAYRLVREVRKVTKKTLITKLSPNVTDIVEIAKAACKGGTDAVSLINTLLGMAIDIKTGKPKLGNIKGGLSGPCIKPIAIRMVWEVSHAIKQPVIGMGGIMNTNDAREFLLAGAKAVQIGTANFIKPGICDKIIKELKNTRHEIKYT